ncbi:hypothetical protein P280DRAFT_388904 [Massarina eburnea CBS 473.64]|uniref:Mid2 domain-containing protein n=1 Tax=Massarina eburnea CBS 473.64 TaxID=1395130 RepID=A0A6A6SGF5_9PLEO|nr:hypothetical protein P280DRAFT_388904 [Massarina eburnea CBS 473.64]
MWTLSTLPISLLFSILVQGITAAEQKCYGLNGVELDNSYGPCNTNAKHSGCCAIHRGSGSADVCLSNGLCMATHDEYMGTIWQAGCTDATGKDTACPKMCPDARTGFDGGKKVLAWNIQMCDYGSYCCREAGDRTSCCNNSTAPKISTNSTNTLIAATVSAIPTQTSSEPTQVFGTAVSTGTPFTMGLSTAELCRDEKQKTASVVGGAVGGIMGAAIIGLLGAMFWVSKKEKRQRKLKEHYEEQFEQSWKYRPGNVMVVYEADGTVMESESEKEKVVVTHEYEGRD